MSRTRGLVKFAAGRVRAPVSELAVEDRIDLFHEFNLRISKYHHENRGGSFFWNWEQATIDSLGDIKGTPGFKLPENQVPNQQFYSAVTRIAVLAQETFDLNTNKVHLPCQWNAGVKVGFCRLCVTQDGNVWFEWYEAKIGKNIRFADVYKAEYKQISSRQEEDIRKLGELFDEHPALLSNYCHNALELINQQATQRDARAKQGRDIFNDLAGIGKRFEISIPT